MRFFKIILFLSSFTSLVNAQPTNPVKNLDRIVAIIGDKIILHSEVELQLFEARQQGFFLGEDGYCKLLEELMFQKLQVHQAEIDSLELTDAQVESELNNRLSQYILQYGGKENFEKAAGMTVERFKEKQRTSLRERMLAQKMQAEITKDIKVTPKEIVNFYNKIPKDSLPYVNERLELAQLTMVPKITNKAKLAAKLKAMELRDKILKKEVSFCFAAIENSCDPGTKTNCGELPLVPKGQMVPEFDAVAFSLKEGEISEVFETTYGFHFMQLLERRGEMYQARHILICPEYSNEQSLLLSAKLDSIYRDLKGGKYSFEYATKKFSDDADTKFNGGKIINQNTGDNKFEPKELESDLYLLIQSINQGEFTPPTLFSTPDNKRGFRIVKLVKRYDAHVLNLSDDYQQVSQAALNAKKAKAIEDWVRNKSKGIYIRVDRDYINCRFDYSWYISE